MKKHFRVPALLVVLAVGMGGCSVPTDSGEEPDPKEDVDDGSGKSPVGLVWTVAPGLG